MGKEHHRHHLLDRHRGREEHHLLDRRRSHRGWEWDQRSSQRIRRHSQRDEEERGDVQRRRGCEGDRHREAGNHRKVGRGRKAGNHSWVGKTRRMMGQRIPRMRAAKESRCCPHTLGGRHGGTQRTQGRVKDDPNRRQKIRTQRKRGGYRRSDPVGRQDADRQKKSTRLPRHGWGSGDGRRS